MKITRMNNRFNGTISILISFFVSNALIVEFQYYVSSWRVHSYIFWFFQVMDCAADKYSGKLLWWPSCALSWLSCFIITSLRIKKLDNLAWQLHRIGVCDLNDPSNLPMCSLNQVVFQKNTSVLLGLKCNGTVVHFST